MLNNQKNLSEKITFSTWLTISRIILTPVVIISMICDYWGFASIIFFIAMLTDLLDGLFARLLKEETFLGACLDPIADKILMVSCYATLAFIKIPFLKIPLWFVYFVLFREISILLGVSYLGVLSNLVPVKPTIFGKITTFVQSCFINWIFLCMFFKWVPVKTYSLLFFVVIILIFSSFLQYIHIGYRGFKFMVCKRFLSLKISLNIFCLFIIFYKINLFSEKQESDKKNTEVKSENLKKDFYAQPKKKKPEQPRKLKEKIGQELANLNQINNKKIEILAQINQLEQDRICELLEQDKNSKLNNSCAKELQEYLGELKAKNIESEKELENLIELKKFLK